MSSRILQHHNILFYFNLTKLILFFARMGMNQPPIVVVFNRIISGLLFPATYNIKNLL